MGTRETAEEILVAHQRFDSGSCLCGWSELGKSHPAHQVAMLYEALCQGAVMQPETYEGRHPSIVSLAKFFSFQHLGRDDLKRISELCCLLAEDMLENLPDGPELTAGLRKLLEAKDCFVRAALGD